MSNLVSLKLKMTELQGYLAGTWQPNRDGNYVCVIIFCPTNVEGPHTDFGLNCA